MVVLKGNWEEVRRKETRCGGTDLESMSEIGEDVKEVYKYVYLPLKQLSGVQKVI